jgi:hypothetical protein
MKSAAMKESSSGTSLTNCDKSKDASADKDLNLLIEKHEAENALNRIINQVRNLT